MELTEQENLAAVIARLQEFIDETSTVPIEIAAQAARMQPEVIRDLLMLARYAIEPE